MVRQGVLSPAESGTFIAERAEYVKIHEAGVDKLCDEMFSSIKDNKLQIPETEGDSIHANKNHDKAVDWIFVADALNFCFWSHNKESQWTVDGFTGYYALEMSLLRALKEGHDITNPDYYSTITKEQLSHIFRGDTKATIPLLDQRVSVLHEVGNILIKKYNKTFVTCIREANKSAVKLMEIIVDNFPCFQDEALYRDQKVSFYKRAQILVSDLWYLLEQQNLGEFYDIDQMTMFADYRVPQVLVYFGVMSYGKELMKKLKTENYQLPSGSDEEVEIRGCSIHAVELVKKKLQEKINTSGIKAEVPNSSLIDYYLWCYRRKHAKALENIPYHKTLGIYY